MTEVPRTPTHRYRDPLDLVWLKVAEDVGWTIDRSSEVFAAYDGAGRLTLGADETLDPDDCLAQMIFHELCHSCVQGPENLASADFGLDNVGGDELAERAALRVQAALLEPLGLRHVMGPTTDFRAFYDSLPDDPFAEVAGDELVLARAGLARVDQAPWGPHIRRGLASTLAIVDAVIAAGADRFDTAEGMPWIFGRAQER